MQLSLVAFLARDYDEAIAWFQKALGFVLLEDTDQGAGKRWVRMAPTESADTAFLIALAVGSQVTGLGKAAAGRVAYFLETDDFATQAARMKAAGVAFEEDPREEPYGTVAVFRDLYGNRWDLIQRHR
ncbi:MAG: VOC family protein [Pseudomonadota bacterium]